MNHNFNRFNLMQHLIFYLTLNNPSHILYVPHQVTLNPSLNTEILLGTLENGQAILQINLFLNFMLTNEPLQFCQIFN